VTIPVLFRIAVGGLFLSCVLTSHPPTCLDISVPNVLCLKFSGDYHRALGGRLMTFARPFRFH